MNYTFVESPLFAKNREDCFKDDEDYNNFQAWLLETWYLHPFIPGSSQLRKVRWADPAAGKGKSGGSRTIYLVAAESHTVFLLTCYRKSERENLNRSAIKILDKLAKAMREKGI